MLEMGEEGEEVEISVRSLVEMEGLVIMWRRVDRIAVAVESEPATLGF